MMVFAISQVLKEGAATAQAGWLGGVTTVMFLALFVLWTLWAFAPWRKDAMDAAARLPFDDDGDA